MGFTSVKFPPEQKASVITYSRYFLVCNSNARITQNLMVLGILHTNSEQKDYSCTKISLALWPTS